MAAWRSPDGRDFGVRDRSGSEGLAAGTPEGDAAVVAAEAALPEPRDLAHRAELVEQPRLVARHPGRQDIAFEHGRRDRESRQLIDDLGQTLERRRCVARRSSLADRCHPLPSRQEPGKDDGVDRFDLPPQTGERPSPEQSEDLGIAPLPLHATGAELAAHDRCQPRATGPGRPRRRRRGAPSGGRLPASGTGRESGRSERATPRARPSSGRGTPAGRRPAAATPTPSRYRATSSIAMTRASPATGR